MTMTSPMVRVMRGEMYIGAARYETTALFRYNPDDPLAVSLQFQDHTAWFSRDLLASGVRFAAGEEHGAVFIARVNDEVEIVLRRNGPGVSVAFGYRAVLTCLQETYDRVPLGEENIHVPDDISSLKAAS